MLLHLITLLTLQLVCHTSAIPVTPSIPNADGNLVLPDLPEGGPSSVIASTFGPLGTPGKRPSGDRLYPPENEPGKWHILFNRYGKDLRKDDGAAVLAKAVFEVDDWIRAAQKGSDTPVKSEHVWTQGSTRLKIKPNWTGYTLGDLKNYITLIVAFHAKYEVYWEWHASLISRGRWSSTALGTAKLQYY
ncbi:MAG: hypothetical protein Q9184_003713 [Pyrenodesmia sp. 2 TL-2023]